MKNTEQGALFPETNWSELHQLGGSQTNDLTILNHLAQAYWKPLVSFAIARGWNKDDALDVTQSFFLKMLGKRILKRRINLKDVFAPICSVASLIF